MNRNSLMVVVSRSNRATSDLTTVHLTGRGNTGALTVMGTGNDSVTHRTSVLVCALTNPRVSIPSAGTCVARLSIVCLFTFRLTLTGRAVDATRYGQLISTLAGVPRTIRCMVSGYRSAYGFITAGLITASDLLCVNENLSCTLSVRNSLGLGRISCVRSRDCTTNRLGRNAVSLVSRSIPIVTITARASVVPGAVDGIIRIGSENTGIVLIYASTYTERLGSNITSCIVRVPRASRLLVPVATIIPLRVLTCCASVGENVSPSGPGGLTGSIAIRWATILFLVRG